MARAIFPIFVLSLLLGGSETKTDPIPHNKLQRQGRHKLYQDQNFTGIAIKRYPNSKAIKAWIPYRDGLRHGLQKKWFPNGTPLSYRFYSADLKHGNHRGWHRNGKKRFYYNFKDDKHTGENWAWHDNGKIAQYFKIEHGRQVAYKQWRYEGKIFWNASRQVDQQVGLKGGRLCRQVKGASDGKSIRL
ncbi:toxin-antitoxin system YwqK family antitoxin [Pseudobacteriovorax antillogorgiicola]|uniref:MORN repeat variant n=1 Tax=Pseudobacteriovorax antillogorgiicola TaxID=1513793 RepID=A0A1Y6BZL1_9BACT|nr:hypothetical protein [Pseudobacteriovorax antillogorgiicola]TCS52403.1 MORN repeat protein [Pseudobacteriovorax antillogorgiicola]SMF28937.1 MORN repeat variant [Pseudobacteriovorax antillogorgiicola]